MATPFKEGVNAAAVSNIARAVANEWPAFDQASFGKAAKKRLAQLELKARVVHVAHALRAQLPQRWTDALAVLEAVATTARDRDDGLRGFAAWPLIDIVGLYGVDEFEASLATLRKLTPLFSAEFAVRPFLAHDPARALIVLRGWVQDPDAHVRRLVSEGTRPRLPWGQKLRAFIADPSPTLPLLEALRDDPSEYVRRSVANHVNDIAKDHPEVAVATLARWAAGASPERMALVRHASRTLVKKGHVGALALHGADVAAPLHVGRLAIHPRTACTGDALSLRVRVRSQAAERAVFVIDYAVHRPTARGATTSKVWKGAKLTLESGEERVFEKRHVLAPTTVRTLHPGRYRVELLVNGTPRASSSFELHPEP